MKIYQKRSTWLLALLAVMGLNASAANIDAAMARATANSFVKQYAAKAPGSIMAPSMTDIKLVYAQASSSVAGAHDFYAFNITGGGFVIVAGESRANQVLGYSDSGHLDFNNLPENLKALLKGYQEEIEYLQQHPALDVQPTIRANSGNAVAPLIKSHWGQEMPYYLQCPTYNGEYCVVGCVATAMTQVMHYWQYPLNSPEISAFYCSSIGKTLPELPATNFEYSKMLNSYCHWDWDKSELIQDTYTDAQAQAVAKLARYCGQAVRMGYSPEGSGAYVDDQLNAMKTFGYSSNAQDVSKSSWWSENYTTEQWEAMIRTELDAGRPILYSANDPMEGGHAFVCDGYDQQGLFHFNFGWYGTCDGWYVSTALNMTHRDGSELHFSSSHEMLIGVEPPEYCVINNDGLTADGNLLVLGDDLKPTATNVHILSTLPHFYVRFSLHDSTGKISGTSNATRFSSEDYAQINTITGELMLPATMQPGKYELRLYYYVSNPRMSTQVNCEAQDLYVVGHVAKYGSSFQVDDVVSLIDYVLSGEKNNVDVQDVTKVIECVLTGNLF